METCFVAADVRRLNIRPLRQLLEEEGFQLALRTDAIPGPGQTPSDLALQVITASSLVLGVLVSGWNDPNAIYELGLASALGKPIVLWVEDEADVPSDLRTLPIIKFAPEAPESLRFALRHAGRQPSIPPPIKAREPRREIHRVQRSHDDLAFWLAEVFRQEGGTVVEGEGGIGSDFALWLPDLEASVGNPFIVEVKHSLETERALELATSQLRHYLSATGGGWGMLIYRMGPPSKEIEAARRWPTVLILRADELDEMLEEASFAEIVHRLRNERAHELR